MKLKWKDFFRKSLLAHFASCYLLVSSCFRTQVGYILTESSENTMLFICRFDSSYLFLSVKFGHRKTAPPVVRLCLTTGVQFKNVRLRITIFFYVWNVPYESREFVKNSANHS